MRALVIHIGEGSTHILLATTRRQDLLEHGVSRRRNILEAYLGSAQERTRHDQLFVMHDQQIRNGADLSLQYLGHLKPDLRQGMLRQAAEAVHHFRDLSQKTTVAISAGLWPDGVDPLQDQLIIDFRKQLPVELRILKPADEALWVLRGVRGIYPSGELACVQSGHWRTLGAWEVPGRQPRLLSWDVGSSRPVKNTVVGNAFPGIEVPKDRPLYISGEHAWLAGALKLGLTFHDMNLLDETVLDDQAVRHLIALLINLTVEERNLIPMVCNQGDCLLEALRLVGRLRADTKTPTLQVCSRGLAHGLASHIFYEGRRT